MYVVYIHVQKFGISGKKKRNKKFQQGCIYLIKNTAKNNNIVKCYYHLIYIYIYIYIFYFIIIFYVNYSGDGKS